MDNATTDDDDAHKGTKFCAGCKEELPLGQFSQDRHKRDGRRYTCKTCHRRRIADRNQRQRAGRLRPEHLSDFFSKTAQVKSGCTEWQNASNSKGYGCFAVDGKSRLTHRLIYELLKGPIPEGHVIDHICENKMCLNVDHLEAVTIEENNRRARESKKRRNDATEA
jgi:hypothetical protein